MLYPTPPLDLCQVLGTTVSLAPMVLGYSPLSRELVVPCPQSVTDPTVVPFPAPQVHLVGPPQQDSPLPMVATTILHPQKKRLTGLSMHKASKTQPPSNAHSLLPEKHLSRRTFHTQTVVARAQSWVARRYLLPQVSHQSRCQRSPDHHCRTERSKAFPKFPPRQ